MSTPILETERLILRPLTVNDAEATFAWLGDDQATQFMPFNTYQCVNEIKEKLTSLKDDSLHFNWGLVLRENNLLIGHGNIYFKDEVKAWSFGYILRFDCWNKGYATEATKAMIQFAHDHCGARKFVARHSSDNPSSGRVMEKCGLQFDHFGEYGNNDTSKIFHAQYYTMQLD
jgi:ribosomal-protein-alanine N-acetyltransferase